MQYKAVKWNLRRENSQEFISDRQTAEKAEKLYSKYKVGGAHYRIFLFKRNKTYSKLTWKAVFFPTIHKNK